MNQPNVPSNPLVHRVLIVVFSIGVALGTGITHGITRALHQAPDQPKSSSVVQQQSIGMAEYERLKLGMTLVEVESILDRGVEIESSTNSATYVWKNPDQSSITVVFKNGHLERKTQTDLK